MKFKEEASDTKCKNIEDRYDFSNAESKTKELSGFLSQPHIAEYLDNIYLENASSRYEVKRLKMWGQEPKWQTIDVVTNEVLHTGPKVECEKVALRLDKDDKKKNER